MQAIRAIPPARRKRLALVIFGLAVVLFFMIEARAALAPFVVGLLFAFLLTPLVRRFELVQPKGWSADRRRLFAVIESYLIVVTLLVLLAEFALPPLVNQIDRFIQGLPNMVLQAQEQISELTERYRQVVPEDIQARLDEAIAGMSTDLANGMQDAAFRTVVVVSQTFSLLLGFFTVPAWLFYVLKDQGRAREFLLGVLPEGAKPTASELGAIIDRTISSYVRGQVFLGFVVGSLILGGLVILGVPFALVLAFIAGVTELIPFLGPVLGAIAGILVTLTNTPDKLPLVIGLYVIVQIIENAFLVPRIQGDAVSIHPAVIMMVLVLASEVAGFWGMLLAVPLTAVCRDIFAYLYQRYREEELETMRPSLPDEGSG